MSERVVLTGRNCSCLQHISGYQYLNPNGNRPTTGNAEPGREDVLFGSAGNDEMLGLEGTDVLNGRSGDGDDRIYAGAGDDFIFGDGEVSGPVFIRPDTDDATDIANWNIDGLQWSASVTEVADRTFRLDWDHAGVADTAGLSGNDLIHAGKGSDYVKAGAGRDTVYGEAGNDLVFGEAGQDNLSGGEGEDVLVGDGGDAEPGEGAADWIDALVTQRSRHVHLTRNARAATFFTSRAMELTGGFVRPC